MELEATTDEPALPGISVGAKGSVRGHLILAKMVIDALEKHRQVASRAELANSNSTSSELTKTVILHCLIVG